MLLLLACTLPSASRVEPSFLEVRLAEGTATGSEEAPLPFTSAGVDVTVSVQALNAKGAPYAFNGQLSLKVRPGLLDQAPDVTVTDGHWEGSVRIKNAFGPSRIWLLDEGDRDTTSGRPPSYAVGVTDTLWFALPTLREMQTVSDTETNNLDREFAEIRTLDRNVAIVTRDAAGFWATDLDDPPGSYNSIYVYTFGRPEDDMVPGARITLLTGNNQEYLATTQLSFPNIGIDPGISLTLPDAFELNSTVGCSPDTIESLESSKVRIPEAVIPADFINDSELGDKYTEYGEWPVQYGDCTVYVISSTTAPDFNPVTYSGTTLTSITGMLKEIYGDPVLVITDPADIVPGPAGPTHR